MGDLSTKEFTSSGHIRSISKGDEIVPEQGWQYVDANRIAELITELYHNGQLNMENLALLDLDDPYTIDDTLKVTHHYTDQKEIMIALKLYCIIAASLLLILMVTGLGILIFCSEL